jgi:hypothetical protein
MIIMILSCNLVTRLKHIHVITVIAIFAMVSSYLYETAATNRPFVHPVNDKWVNMKQQWNATDGIPKHSEETCSNATLATTIRT